MVQFENKLTRIRASWSFFHFTLYPLRKTIKKPSKKLARKKAAPRKKREPYFELSSISDAIRFARRAAGKLLKKIVIERFELSVTVASDDPAKTGILYGGASMAIGILLPLFDDTFNVKERTISAFVDFTAHDPTMRMVAVLFVRPIQMIVLSLLLATHLPIKKRKKDKAVSVS